MLRISLLHWIFYKGLTAQIRINQSVLEMENNILKVMIWGMEVGRLYWHNESRKANFSYTDDFLSLCQVECE